MTFYRVGEYKTRKRGKRSAALTLPAAVLEDLGIAAGESISVYRGTLRGGVAETPIAVLSAGSSPYVLIEDKTMYRAEPVSRQAVIKDEGAS